MGMSKVAALGESSVREEEKALKVLWVSKNRMVREELRQLRAYAAKQGLKLVLDSYTGSVPSVEWLVRKKILAGGFNVVVAVLPLTMIARLIELGRQYDFEVWRPKVERLHFDRKIPCPDYDGSRDWVSPSVDANGEPVFAHKRFLYFEKVLSVELSTEPIEVE